MDDEAYYPYDEDEIAILPDDTIRVFSYYDYTDDVRKYFSDYIEYESGDELQLGHINPGTQFRYVGTVDRDGEPHFKFDCPKSDFPVYEVVLSANDFIREVGNGIW